MPDPVEHNPPAPPEQDPSFIPPGQILTRPHRELNNQAMTAAMLADMERSRGRRDLAKYWFNQALHYEMANLALYFFEQGLLPSITHRSAGWLAMSAGDAALARDLAARGLSIEPHPMIKPELEELRNQANYVLAFPNCPENPGGLGKIDHIAVARHPGRRQRVPGRHSHHAGFPDKSERWFRNNPSNTGTPTGKLRQTTKD